MTPDQIWRGVIGALFTIVGVSIIGIVASLLYGPGLSIPAGLTGGRNSSNAEVFVCPDAVTVSAKFSGEQAFLKLSDGRTVETTRTPSSSGSGAEEEPWERYASLDETFVFWRKGDIALIQEDGIVVQSECVILGE